MSVAQSARESIDHVLSDLAAARDEARLKTHLLSLDARLRLNQLETRLHALELRLREGGGPVESALETAHELTRAVRQLLTHHTHPTLNTCVTEFMSRGVRTCSEADSLADAARIMREADCGIVPVLNQQGRLVGVLTDRDVCMAAYASGALLADIPVSNVIAGEVACVRADESAQEVINLMQKHRVRRIPVLGRDGALVGIVSLADLRSLKDLTAENILLETLALVSEPRPVI